MNSKNTIDVISLQASPSGNSDSNMQNGLQIDLFGPVVAPASHILLPESSKVKRMKDTYGPGGNSSLSSQAFQQCLVSKLAEQLPKGGLTMFIKGWNRMVTPSGRLYYQLAVLERGTKDIGCGLWATPNTMDSLPLRSEEAMKRQFMVARKGRSTPGNLRGQVQFCTYPKVLWPTPISSDMKGAQKSKSRQGGLSLGAAARISRKALSGSTAPMGKAAQLNPIFSFWLMGLSSELVYSMQRGMASFINSQGSSSKRAKKQ